MRLENLYTNFATMSPEEQTIFVADYRFRRAEDMDKPSTYQKKKGKVAKPEFSEDEKAVMKALGIKPKDFLLLRAAMPAQAQEDTIINDDELLEDKTFTDDESEGVE